jgi:hypothetical protein
MNFVGTGKRLAQNDIGDAAKLIGIPTAGLLAFLEVEANGRGFDNQNRPKMLFEPHVFYRELVGISGQALAVAQGLAYKSWGAQPYPKESYSRLERAQGIHEAKALRSASWGLSQILGDKANICGFGSEQEFVKAIMQGEREQLIATVTLMKAWGMDKMLAGKDLSNPDSWRLGASKWNGTGYAKHGYHIKLANSFIKHNGTSNYPDKVSPMSPSTVLVNGMKSESILNLQKDLASLGYVFTRGIDGRFGDETENNVRLAQSDWKISIDGKVGTEFMKALKTALSNSTSDKSPAPPVWEDQKDKPVSGTNKANPLLVGLVVVVIIVIGSALKYFNII